MTRPGSDDSFDRNSGIFGGLDIPDRTEILSMIAHDMRSPLMSILGALEMLDSEVGMHDAPQHLIEVARRSARRLESLARELTDLSQARSGGMALERSAQDLALAVERGVADVSVIREHQHKSILPVIECSAHAEIDAQRLGRALQNVLVNALQHARTSVFVTLSVDGQQACIAVEDDGDGVDDGLLPTVFEPFARGGSGGTGLGLAITREVLAAHGGRVAAANRPDGPGARFELWLPILPSDGRSNGG